MKTLFDEESLTLSIKELSTLIYSDNIKQMFDQLNIDNKKVCRKTVDKFLDDFRDILCQTKED